MKIYPFNFGSHYDAIEAIDRKVWPMEYQSADERKSNDNNWNPDYFQARFLCEVDRQFVAHIALFEPFWIDRKDIYGFNLNVDPQFENRGIGNALYDKAMRELAPKKPQKLIARTREDKTQAIRFIEKRNFVLEMRELSSQLAVQKFDDTPFKQKITAVAESGFNIFSWAELEAADPNHWEEKLWELDWPIYQDIPTPQTPKRLSLTDFKKRYANVPKDGCFVAVDGSSQNGNYIGYTYIISRETVPKKLFTGTTGVLRDYRRRGITTALKVRVIEWAKANGYDVIKTDNEENNPMHSLNMQLGYQKVPDWLFYGKDL